MMKTLLKAICCLVLISVVSGCGDAGPERFPVKGTVLLDGKPLDRATIIMIPKGPGFSVAAEIRAGAFELPVEFGPTAGEFHVRINPNEMQVEEVADSSQLPQATSRPRIPKFYQREGALDAKINGEPNQELVFQLTSRPR